MNISRFNKTKFLIVNKMHSINILDIIGGNITIPNTQDTKSGILYFSIVNI
jgi:hypothetical protein